MIVLKIDVTKIDKAHLFQGKTAKYLDCALHDNKAGTDQFGNDGYVTQSVSKEARERGEKGPIIGNWKTVGGAKKSPPKPAPKPQADPDLDAPESEQVPF